MTLLSKVDLKMNMQAFLVWLTP